MRIVYLTQWFEPEPNIVKGVGFVRALEAAGHEVTVVTGLPNYPTGRLYPGYRLRLVQHETIGGVRVVRLPLYPSHDSSSLRRSLNYLSFFLSLLAYCLFRARRFDAAYAYHPPITVGLAAALAGRLRRLPFVLDVQDLWPDTVAATGMSGAGRIARLLNGICNFVYRRAAAIIVQSNGMRGALIDRGVPAPKITTVYNWSDGEAAAVPDSSAHESEPFTIVYGGNLGRAQALETVVDAAAILQSRRKDVRILLHGDGVDADALRDRAAGLPNLQILPRVSREDITPIFARANALLLHLRDDPLFAITIPSKTQYYLSMDRPIVAGVAGEAADLLRRSGAALVVPPGDAEALAGAMDSLAASSPARLAAMGASGRRFYMENLSFDRALARTISVLEGINRDRRHSD